MESNKIIKNDIRQNENVENDVKLEKVLKNEGNEICVSNEVKEGGRQQQLAEEAIKNSGTCEGSDKNLASRTEVDDVKIEAVHNSPVPSLHVLLTQFESMEQETTAQSQENIETVGSISHITIIADENNTNNMESNVTTNANVIESSAVTSIQADKSETVLNSTKEDVELSKIETIAAPIQEQVLIFTEQIHQEVQEKIAKITQAPEADIVANNSALNGTENSAQKQTENIAVNDVPQIIENLVLVKSFSEQPTMHIMDVGNVALSPAETQSDLEAPMETNESTTLEATCQILELPNITVPAAISQSPETSIIPASQTGLSMLAQYDSEDDSEEDSDDVAQKLSDNEIEKISDTESVVEVPITNRDYRSRVVEIDSGSDSETDSSDSDIASEVSYLAEIRKAIDKSIDVDADADCDAADEDEYDDNGARTKRQPPRVKGEFLIDDLPPIQDLHITVPEAECVELGKVHSIVDQLVLVNALANSLLLDLETVLFLDKGQRVLGEVFDVLGQVADPLYCVRFNSNKQILEKNIKVGDLVFVAPKTQYTQFVILSSLMKMRGSDASWENDVEPPPRYLDYSDDEQERDARAKLRNRDRSTDHWDPSKRARSDLDFSSPSPSMSPSPSQSPSPFPRNPFQQMRPRGGRGGYRPPRYQYPAQEYHQRPSYNAGSWHSNYPQAYAVPPQNYAPIPPQHVMYSQPPPPNFAAYPPQPLPMQPYAIAQPNLQQPPPQVYVLNPYAVRSPVLAPNSPQTPMYTTVMQPPPPPGNI